MIGTWPANAESSAPENEAEITPSCPRFLHQVKLESADHTRWRAKRDERWNRVSACKSNRSKWLNQLPTHGLSLMVRRIVLP